MSAPEGHTARPPSKGRLIAITLGAFAVAGVIAVAAVLPAEYGVDPLGLGEVTGLTRLYAKPVKTETVTAPVAGVAAPPATYSQTPYRSDEVDIPLAASPDEERGDELEYKVRMKAGDTLTYSWTVEGLTKADEFYFDFHGERPAEGDTVAKVVEYRQEMSSASAGSLVAPMPGVHGWYLQNQSEKPVTVHLKIAGFYELVPPGEYGNEAGIKAKTAR